MSLPAYSVISALRFDIAIMNLLLSDFIFERKRGKLSQDHFKIDQVQCSYVANVFESWRP